MAVLTIEEYADFARSGAAVPAGAPIAVQQISLSGVSSASSTFNAKTRLIAVQANGDFRFQIAASPTAVDDSTCARVSSGTVRAWAFPAGNSGLKIAAITAA